MWRIFSKAAGIVAYLSLQAVVNPIYPHSPKQAQVTGMHSIAAPQGINASPLVLPVVVATLFHCPWGRKTSTDPQLPSSSVQFRSVAQSCPTICDPMNRSTPGLPVHQKLPEFTQTHVHRVSDVIQPSHPLSSPSPAAPNSSQHQGLSQWVNSLNEVAKVLEFQLQHQSFQWTPRTDLL